ncbi:glutaredoxin family protein [Methylomicrobium sp. Wu6]|uniref:glutaredoxin family protein n=1 Tax=Methylomicrobium sp. Wu6 TaxID=3107928 RepID=UPI002DD62B75|nr:glutaredoxin family protein [Methylomicrobium sp. Wu6]MEC4748665.1 glutaredoxin family protein [Methylomicrobium sp. Wu6]
MRLLLLGTEGCHLCEDAQSIITACMNEIAPDCSIEPIDIAEQTQWQPDYAIKIPVLLEPVSGRELNWPFDHDQVTYFLLIFKTASP